MKIYRFLFQKEQNKSAVINESNNYISSCRIKVQIGHRYFIEKLCPKPNRPFAILKKNQLYESIIKELKYNQKKIEPPSKKRKLVKSTSYHKFYPIKSILSSHTNTSSIEICKNDKFFGKEDFLVNKNKN